MANSFDLAVAYTATCEKCDRRKTVSYSSATNRPYNAADYLKECGWVYRNASGWTCDNCVAADPAARRRQLAGLQTRLKNANDDIETVKKQIAFQDTPTNQKWLARTIRDRDDLAAQIARLEAANRG